MDRILIIIVLLLTLLFWLIKNRDHLSYSKLAEILIAFYILICAFPRITFPIYTVPGIIPFGEFGNKFRFSIYLLLIPFFLIVLANQMQWKIKPIKKIHLLIALVIISYILLNPFNTVIASSLIPIAYFLSYFLFLYLIYATCKMSTIINGIYMGFTITVILHFILSILFPVLGIKAATTIFAYDAAVRSADRAGAVGTFSHPNVLGVYASYYLMFFLGCCFAKFRFRKSAILAAIAFIVIVLSGSRSALMASIVGLLAMVCLYSYRKYRIFSPSILFKGVLPVIIVSAILLYFTPIYNLFFNSDMDDMMLARTMHYICGLEMFKEHPLIGVGLNHHLKYLNDNITIDFQLLFSTTEAMGEEFVYTVSIHNIWIILIVELGSIGFAAIVFYLFRFFYLFKKRIKHSISQSYNISLLTTLGIICCLLVQGNSDWAPLTEQALNISLLFFFLSSNGVEYINKTNDPELNDHVIDDLKL